MLLLQNVHNESELLGIQRTHRSSVERMSEYRWEDIPTVVSLALNWIEENITAGLTGGPV